MSVVEQLEAPREREVVTTTAATLAVVEIGLGSVLHGLRVPFGGHFLSLNQGFFLSRATWKLRDVHGAFKAPFYVSQISALLKSLAPAGNKLGPMLSISVQGFLFAFSIAIFGANLFGIAIGMAISSVWAFVQPFVTLYLFFGHGLVEAGGFYLEKMEKTLGVSPTTVGYALLTAIAVKAALAVATGIVATRVNERHVARMQALAERRGGDFARRLAVGTEAEARTTAGQRARLALRDLTRPFFLLSMGLMIVFFVFAEGAHARQVWTLLRPLAIAFLFFYFARSPWFGRLGDRLRRSPRAAEFMSHFDQTLKKLRS